MKRTTANYRRAVEYCILMAGKSHGWNLRFLLALDAHGLMLEKPERQSRQFSALKYPGGNPVTAPLPSDTDGIKWDVGTVIVWKDEEPSSEEADAESSYRFRPRYFGD